MLATATVPTILLAGLAALSLVLTAGVTGAVCWHLRRRGNPEPQPQGDASWPAISILKPLKGVDEGLYDNLASLTRQDYPRFELVLGTADAEDPALEVVERLRRDFPHVSISVVAGSRPLGLNPKVSNLAALAARARHDWWLISDSDVRAEPDYLRTLARETFDPEVGLVTSAFTGVGGESLGAVFDNLHLGTFVAGSMTAARMVGHPLVVGKSMLFRRRDLEALGGWWGVRNILAEDYILGCRFAAAGHRVALARKPLTVIHRHRPLRSFVGRHLRWSQMRRRISLAAYLGEPLLNPTPWLVGLLTAAAAGATLGPLGPAHLAGLATGGMGIKVLLDALQLRRLAGAWPRATHLAWIPVKDLLIAGLWLVGLFRRTLDWRGNRLRVAAGSELQAPAEGAPAWVEELLAAPPPAAGEAREGA